jgi:FtsH-binding integral membrane protein
MRYDNDRRYPASAYAAEAAAGYEDDFGPSVAAQAASSERAAFIRRTYAHLGGAILAFVGLEALLLQVVTAKDILAIFGGSPWSLLLVFLAFWAASWVAQVWARSETSRAMQYLGLALYVVAEAVIMLPLLYICAHLIPNGQTLIPTAGILALSVFAGLTLSVFLTGKDYTFLAPVLSVGSMLALGLIVAALFFPIGLGLWFSFAMVALMSGFILYETSHIMLYHRTDQPVAAALALFASVATLFFYILRILMALSSRD